MFYIIFWIITGAILGWLTTLIIHNRRKDLPINIVAGITGAVVAGYLLVPLFRISMNKGELFSLPALLVSLIGAVILLVAVNLIRRQNDVTGSAIDRQWEQFRPKMHVRWEKLTDQDLAAINSHHDQLIGTLQERYGCAKKDAEEQIQRYFKAILSG